MSTLLTNARIAVSVGQGRIGISIPIGDVLVTVGAPAFKDAAQQSEAQVRLTALRLAARALEVAQQEIAQEQG